MRRLRGLLSCLLVACVLRTVAGAATLQTDDGMVLKLAENGQAAGLRIGDRDLPVTPGGGFWVADVAAAEPPNLLPNGGLEEAGPDPQPVRDWTTSPNPNLPGCQWTLDGRSGRPGKAARLDMPVAHPDHPSLPLTVGQPVKLRPGAQYRLSAWARWASVTPAQNPGIYLVFRGANGQLRQAGLYFGEAMSDRDWTPCARTFTAGPDETSATVYCNLYGAQGTVWVDDLRLTEVGRPPAESWRRRLTAPLKRDGGALVQEQSWSDVGLKLKAMYASAGQYVSVSGHVEDLTGKDRAVEMTWELPLDATGWQWADDIVSRRPIGHDMVYRTTWECPAGPGYNQVYPFVSVADGSAGLAVGAGLAQGPRVYSIEYDHGAKCLLVRSHFGLSRQVKGLPGKAWFGFLLYRHDGAWGLRSAAERFYGFFPADFAKRVPYEGYLGYAHLETPDARTGPAALYDLPAPGDFGRGFRWFWHQHTAYSAVRYETDERPHPDDATVRQLLGQLAGAQGNELPYKWGSGEFDLLGQRRRVTWEEPAWSLQRRLYEGPTGQITWVGDSRYEEETPDRGPGWLLNFQVTEDPDISTAVRDSLMAAIRQWESDVPDREPFTWCVSCDGTGFVGRQLDCRPEHIASSAAPLTYDLVTRKVSVADVTWEWNSKVLGPLSAKHQFLLHRNFICGTPFVGANIPFVDIGLIEYQYGGYGMDEASDLYVRTVGNQKVFRYWFYPATGPKRDASIREMFHRGLVYAIYPHLVPEPEAYRHLYQVFLPAIEQLSAAGWQPVTLARADNPRLRVERYGTVERANLSLACRNTGGEPLRARVTLDAALGLNADGRDVVVRDLLSGRTVTLLTDGGRLVLPVALPAGESTAYSILPRLKRLQADLLQAADAVRQAAPLDVTEEASYTSSRPAQFIADGTPPPARPERVLCDGWVAYQGLVWPAGEPVEITLDLNSPQRLQSVQVHYGWGETYGAPACAIEGRDAEGNWHPLAALSELANGGADHSSRTAIEATEEYQFIRLRYPALTRNLWLQEIALSGLDGAMLRAAERFELLAANPNPDDFGVVSQLALALRVRRMLGHDRTLQERALQALTAFCSLGSGVEVSVQVPEVMPADVATPAWLVVTNRSHEAFREGSIKLRLPPGWRAAPSKFDLTVYAGKTVKQPLDLFAPPGPAQLSLLVTGVVGPSPIFLNTGQAVLAERPLSLAPVSPFAPLGQGTVELLVGLHSRAAVPVAAEVTLQSPEGQPLGEPQALTLAPEAVTVAALSYKPPEASRPGKVALALHVRYAETEAVFPFETYLTARQGLCARAQVPPRVDGDLGDAGWQMAPELTGLVLADGRPATQATTARLLWDQEKLYAAIRCAESAMARLQDSITGRDAPVWQGDDVALVLNCGGTSFKLEVGASGAFLDAREGDAAWDGDWQVKTTRGTQGWTVEASVPWSSLGWEPRSGLALGVNVCRQEKPHGEVSYWVPGDLNDGWNVGAVVLSGS
mgnify:CR=1 FL=1